MARYGFERPSRWRMVLDFLEDIGRIAENGLALLFLLAAWALQLPGTLLAWPFKKAGLYFADRAISPGPAE